MRIFLLSMVVSMAAALAQAGGPLPAAFRVEKTAGTAPLHSAFGPSRGAVGVWGVAPAGGSVRFEIECLPFEHEEHAELPANATLRLTQTNARGVVQTRIVRPQDRTDLRRGRSSARVAAVVSGMGVSYLQLEVQVDDGLHAAGQYDARIVTSLSGSGS